jgi:hypothetical protein
VRYYKEAHRDLGGLCGVGLRGQVKWTGWRVRDSTFERRVVIFGSPKNLLLRVADDAKDLDRCIIALAEQRQPSGGDSLDRVTISPHAVCLQRESNPLSRGLVRLACCSGD